jgi:hypothetical protein
MSAIRLLGEAVILNYRVPIGFVIDDFLEQLIQVAFIIYL